MRWAHSRPGVSCGSFRHHHPPPGLGCQQTQHQPGPQGAEPEYPHRVTPAPTSRSESCDKHPDDRGTLRRVCASFHCGDCTQPQISPGSSLLGKGLGLWHACRRHTPPVGSGVGRPRLLPSIAPYSFFLITRYVFFEKLTLILPLRGCYFIKKHPFYITNTSFFLFWRGISSCFVTALVI